MGRRMGESIGFERSLVKPGLMLGDGRRFQRGRGLAAMCKNPYTPPEIL
jgi:hypothetical protein